MKRSGIVIVAMIVGITLLLWAGIHNRRERMLAMQQAAAKKALSFPESAAAGDEAPQAPKMLGKVAPAFTLVDLAGKKVSLADYKGKPVLVNFWATWCAPCKLEMPWFEEFGKKYSDLVILGVDQDDVADDAAAKASMKKEIEKAAKSTGVSYPILLPDSKIANAYGGIELLPTSFYVGKNGVVLEETSGLGGKDEIEANIKKLLAGGQ